jgi:hypothetical protein
MYRKGHPYVTFVQLYYGIAMHYRLITITALATLLLTSCASVGDCLKGVTVQNFSVTLDKGMCFGQCPVFNGSVLGDRNVMYNGIRFTEREGMHKGTVSESDLCDIITEIRNNNIMSLDTNYRENVADAPETELRVVYAGKVRTFRWNLSTPDPLKKLEALMIKHTHENGTLRKF